MARVELSETTKVPFGGRGARRKPDKEGGSLNEVKTTHDAVWRRESRHAPAKARKEANVDAPKKAKLSKGTFERSENPKGA